MKIDKARQVYILYNPELNIVKIGISENIKARKAVLEKECGCELSLIYESEHLINAEKHEKEIHDAFIEKRRIGEWFNITPQEAMDTTVRLLKNAIYDPLIGEYKKGVSISQIAKQHNVTRQAVIVKLRTYGVYGENEQVCEVFPIKKTHKSNRNKHNISTAIVETTTPNVCTKPIGEHKRQLPNMKRVEANINHNGDWYEGYIFKSGAFSYFYSKSIDEVRAQIKDAKDGSQ